MKSVQHSAIFLFVLCSTNALSFDTYSNKDAAINSTEYVVVKEKIARRKAYEAFLLLSVSFLENISNYRLEAMQRVPKCGLNLNSCFEHKKFQCRYLPFGTSKQEISLSRGLAEHNLCTSDVNSSYLVLIIPF